MGAFRQKPHNNVYLTLKNKLLIINKIFLDIPCKSEVK